MPNKTGYTFRYGRLLSQFMNNNIKRAFLLRILQCAWMHVPVLVVFLQNRSMTLGDVFIIKGIGSLVSLVMELPTGYFADRFGRRNSIALGAIACCAAPVIYCLSWSLPGFILAEAVLSLGASFIAGADTALIYDTLLEEGKEEQYPQVEARLGTLAGFAEALGGLAGGLLAAADLSYPFYFQSFLYLLFFWYALKLVEPAHHMRRSVSLQVLLQRTREILIQDRTIRHFIYLSSISATATFSTVWFAQDYMKQSGVPIILFGAVWAAFHSLMGLASFFSRGLLAKLGASVVFLLIAILLSLNFILLSFSDGLGGLVFIAAMYIVRGVRVPLVRICLNRMISSDLRATVLSLHNFIFRLMFVIAGPLFGFVAARYTLSVALQISALFIVVPSVFLITGLKNSRAFAAD